MTAQLLEGKPVADAVIEDVRQRVAALAARGVVPGLGTILVGDDPASAGYVRKKHETCALVGMASFNQEIPASAGQDALLAEEDGDVVLEVTLAVRGEPVVVTDAALEGVAPLVGERSLHDATALAKALGGCEIVGCAGNEPDRGPPRGREDRQREAGDDRQQGACGGVQGDELSRPRCHAWFQHGLDSTFRQCRQAVSGSLLSTASGRVPS